MTHYYRVIKVREEIFVIEVFDNFTEKNFFPQVLCVTSDYHYHLFEFYIPLKFGQSWEALAVVHLIANEHREPAILELREYTKLIRSNRKEVACAWRKIRTMSDN